MSMAHEKRGLLLIIASLLIIQLAITSCTMFERQSAYSPMGFENNKYYQGFNGVEMYFVPGLPPSRLYYYGTNIDNSFDVQLEVMNIGSSWARGGVFISGYDPTMIQFQGVNPIRSSGRACMISLGNIGYGQAGATLRCDDYFIGASSDLSMIDVFLNDIGSTFNMGRITGGTDISWQKRGDQNVWGFNFNNPGIDMEYANHGRLLITMFSGLDFSRNFGQEYLLAGDTYESPGGEIGYVNFDGNIISWPAGLDQSYQSFLITNCFLYATYAAPQVCIDPAPFSQDRKVCIPSTYTGTAGQGAPVAVTYIYQENSPLQATFEIHIKNVGGGQVYDPGMLETCSPYFPARVTAQNLNTVYIGDIRVSGDLQMLQCMPNNYVRLDPNTGEGIITCTYQFPFSGMRSAYLTPLVVELWYGYSKTIESRVVIKRAL
jgi:hypothetical protein